MLGIRALFNWFARPRGPRPEPIKVDPSWFPVPQTVAAEPDEWLPPGRVPPKPHLPPWEPPWVQAAPSSEPEWEPPWVAAFAAPPEDESPPEAYWEPDGPDYGPPADYPDDSLYADDPGAFAEDNPYWGMEPSEPEDDEIHVQPGEKVPFDAGELLETYYVVGVGDVRVFARIHPDDMDLHPDQIIERPSLRRSFNVHFRPKGPKPPE